MMRLVESWVKARFPRSETSRKGERAAADLAKTMSSVLATATADYERMHREFAEAMAYNHRR